PAQAEMADLDQPFRRGHDALRRGLCRPLPAVTPGPAVVLLLAAALPRHHDALATVSQPAYLGRVCRTDLLHRLAHVLVRRPDPRPGNIARPGQELAGTGHLRRAGDGMAWLGPALEALRDRLPPPGWTGDTAGRVGAHGREL